MAVHHLLYQLRGKVSKLFSTPPSAEGRIYLHTLYPLLLMNRQLLRQLSFFLVVTFTFAMAKADIIEKLNSPGSTITVEQPDALARRVAGSENPESTEESGEKDASQSEEKERPVQMSKGKIVGYRVQVYADNNVRVAKGQARQRERAISSRFPYATYVAYVSPYWRLRVGDFKTQAEAEKAAAEIKRAFPSYSREVRIVRDRINAR